MRPLLLSLLGLTSCTFIFQRLAPPECASGAPSVCSGDNIVICQEGFEAEIPCDIGEECAEITTGVVCVLPICGDGIKTPSEACDDTNLNNGDGCDSNCQIEVAICGNGVVEFNESCDDGNVTPGDGCSDSCVLESCGDGSLNPGEQCDDGNLTDGDGCSATCTIEDNGVCGNGATESGEQCDDGNTTSGDGCSAQCQNEAGHLFEIELNDSGAHHLPADPNNNPELQGNDFVLNAFNTLPSSDLLIHGALAVRGDEDYFKFTNTTNAPLDITAQAFIGAVGQCNGNLGDLVLNLRDEAGNVLNVADDTGLEVCPFMQLTVDPGETIYLGIMDFAEEAPVASYLLSFSSCGDGNVVPAELCDDGDQIEGNGCDTNCLPTGCGNNIQSTGEACDDGNLFNGDGCSSVCVVEVCGDGVINNADSGPTEQCDDGNTANGDGCDSTCHGEPAIICTLTTPITGDTSGDNSGGTGAFEVTVASNNPFCGLGSGHFGREDVYTFTSAVAGQLQLDLTSQVDLVLYARQNCTDGASQLGCSDEQTNGTETITINVAAGQPLTIIVDGFDEDQNGAYTLGVTPL